MDFHIRDFQKKDLAAVLGIMRASFTGEFEISGFSEQSVRGQLKFYSLIKLVERFVGKAFLKVYVGEVKGQVVGAAFALNRNDESWTINMVMVDPKHRRRGYGKKLVQKAYGDATLFRAKRMILYVLEDNVPAKNLYKSLGFVKFERRTYFRREACELNETRLPFGYELVKVDFYNREALRIIDACRDEASAKVYGTSGPLPFYVKFFAKFFRTGKVERHVIKRNDLGVGVYTFNFQSQKEVSGVSFYLYEEHRGRGIEKCLITKALNKAFKLGVPALIIDFNEKNTELRKACEELGFRKSFVMEGMAKILEHPSSDTVSLLSSKEKV